MEIPLPSAKPVKEPRFTKKGEVDLRFFNKGPGLIPARNHPWRNSFGNLEHSIKSGFKLEQ